MSGPVPPIILNAHQRRHFEVLFGRLEESLTRIERLLATTDSQRSNTLSIDAQDIPDSYRSYAAPILAALRKRIATLTSALALAPHPVSRARAVAATLTAESIRIEDSMSSQLRGYGVVDPSVVNHLDPALMDIAGTLRTLASTLSHHSPPVPKR